MAIKTFLLQLSAGHGGQNEHRAMRQHIFLDVTNDLNEPFGPSFERAMCPPE